MATVDDVLAAIKHVTQCTGDPNAWRSGLTDDQLGDGATMFAASPQRLDVLTAAIRHQHPDLFGPDREEGDAADAVRSAEAALAHQGSATAQLDLQVIVAILSAHQRTVEGRDALNKLQHDVEAAIRARTDLDTPAGARDFQRFLIGKLDEMRAIVAGANLDDTSKSALMAACASLYDSSENGQGDEKRGQPVPTASPETSRPGGGQVPPELPDAEMDPYLDALPADDAGLAAGGVAAQSPAPPSSPSVPVLPSLGGGAAPGPAPGWGSPGGFGLPGLPVDSGPERLPGKLDDAELQSEDSNDQPSREVSADNQPDEPAPPLQAATGSTIVVLPNGETITAASPELAAVIKAAVDGTPIAEAFEQQGINIPVPGTAIVDPVDPAQVAPGDIGMFTTRHALALGRGEALMDGQIQHISVVTGPSFLGWEHPPVPVTAGAPAKSDPPTPTRPAADTAAAQ